jgi:hypothetical protein
MRHKLYPDKSCLQLLDDLRIETVRPKRKLMPKSNGQKTKLQQEDIETGMGVN